MRAASSIRTALGLALLLGAAAGAHGHETRSDFDAESAIRYSQEAIGRQLGDQGFLDRRGKPVRLADYLGKPLVVNLVYTACTDTCPLIVQTLYRAVEIAQEALGEDSFSVLTIGFDTTGDTPARMRAYATSQGVDLPNWGFLSTDHETIDRLTETLGFIYSDSPKGFDHLAQTTVIDAEGRVYRQVYGADFGPPALVEPLKDLVFARRSDLSSLSGLINRVRLFCTLYDPASQRYRFDYSLFIALSVGFLSLCVIGTILVRGLLQSRRHSKHEMTR